MGTIETRAEEMGRHARQTAIEFFDWRKLIVRIDELFQEGEDFHSIDQVPPDFRKLSKEVAGNNAQLLFKLFDKVTSKTREIAEGGGSIYRPYVYDVRDPNSAKVLGLKMGRRGGLNRLATLQLGILEDASALTLSIQNTRLPESTPDLVFQVKNEAVTIKQTRQQVKEDERWLDEKFDSYIEEVLTEAHTIFPNIIHQFVK